MKSKHLLHLLMMALLVPGIVNAQNLPANSPKSEAWQEVTINNDSVLQNNGNTYVPFCGQMVNGGTHSQFIIPASRLASIAGSKVRKLTFYNTTETESWGNATFKVYMAEVEDSQFAQAVFYDWNSLTKVFEGQLNVTNYKMEVNIPEEFHYIYSGDNLLIGFDLGTTGTSNVSGWQHESTGVNSCLYTIENPFGQPIVINGDNYVTSLPKMSLEYMTLGNPRVYPVTAVVTGNTATMSWNAPSAQVIGYKYQYREVTNTWPEAWSETTATSVEITDLNPGSEYDFRVKALYAGSNESVPTRVRFVSDCPIIMSAPYSENFDSYVIVESNQLPEQHILPRCWDYINESDYFKHKNFPTMCYYYARGWENETPYAYTKSNSLMFTIINTPNADPQPQYAILPPVQHIQLLRVSCKAVKTIIGKPTDENNIAIHYSSTFKIGVMEEDDSFTPLGTFTPNNYSTANPTLSDFMDCEVDFSSYTGTGNRIAFMMEVPTSSTIKYGRVCIDNIDVTYNVPMPSVFIKEIDSWTEGSGTTAPGGWYLISSPLYGETNPADVQNMLNNTNPEDFDLYRFEQAVPVNDGIGLEWENWKVENFDLEPLRGYLYANREGDDLIFSGVPYYGDGKVTLSRVEDCEFTGWNLIGNPWGNNYASIGRSYYRINPETGAEVIAGTGNVAPMEAVFVIADQDGETVTFTKVTRNTTNGMAMALDLSHNNDLVIDRAILRFDEGSTLPKFQLNPNNTKVYIPQNGKDYAVVNAEGQGEMPINFRAAENGYYTLALNNENVAFSYLHLIDNMTSADIDLLSTPSYTFKAKTTDYESRFRLVYVSGNAEGNESFGFFNESGNFTVYGIEGEATLQMIDVMGRVLSTENFNGNIEMKVDTNPGIYMFRLINGDNVKVQKVVVK